MSSPGVLNQEQLNSLNSHQTTTIDDLKKLQNVEMDLFKSLQQAVSTGSDQTTKDTLLTQIKSISDVRHDMYKRLVGQYRLTQDNVSQTRSNLVDQFTLVDIMQQQLDNLHDNINIILNAKNDRMRMVEINTYFGKQYEAQKELMQIIVLTAVPLLILAILSNAGTLGYTLAGVLGTIVIAIGLVFIVRKVIDISSRSNVNFDEYDWQFDPNSQKPTVTEYDSTSEPTYDDTMGCYSQECCAPGTVFNASIGKCVPQISGTGLKKIGDKISNFATNLASNVSNSQPILSFSESFENMNEEDLSNKICPLGFNLIKNKEWLESVGLGNNTCGSGWHNECTEPCAFQRCYEAEGTWIPTDYSYSPYLCSMSEGVAGNAKPTPK